MVLAKKLQSSRNILEDLFRSNLPLQTEKKDRVLHNTHDFATKGHPTVPRLFIQALTAPGDVVLDPMCGSGTALIEAALLNRSGIGVDIDPLAVKISQMKTCRLDPRKVKTSLNQIANHAFLNSLSSPAKINQFLQCHYSEAVLDFFHDWFSQELIFQLACLIQEIRQIAEPACRNLFEVIFSSIILARQGGLSPAHGASHPESLGLRRRDDWENPRDVIQFFREKGEHALGFLEEFAAASGRSSVVMGDARNLSLPENSVDLIMTSPPYPGTMDCTEAHKYSFYWLDGGYGPFKRRRGDYIGAQVIRDETEILQRDNPELIPELPHTNRHTACLLGQYFQDMAQSLSEMYRVLKPGKAAIVQAGPVNLQGGGISSAYEIIGALAEAIGFQWVGTSAKAADHTSRGLFPVSRVGKADEIRARRPAEYVLGLVKQGDPVS
jgi:DNA modification methylase